MLTRDENQKIDEEFLEKRVRDAWEYRKKVTDTSSCRLIFGEADFLPGLVVDKFEDVLVVQSLALGIDRLKNTIPVSYTHLAQNTGQCTDPDRYPYDDRSFRRTCHDGMDLRCR